jgi:hypothetical protein
VPNGHAGSRRHERFRRQFASNEGRDLVVSSAEVQGKAMKVDQAGREGRSNGSDLGEAPFGGGRLGTETRSPESPMGSEHALHHLVKLLLLGRSPQQVPRLTIALGPMT